MGKKSDAPEAPDYGPLIASQERLADRAFERADEQFAWAKQAYAENKEIVDATSSAFLEAMEFNQENARKDRARYESVYQPLEDALVADAESYASPERMAEERGRAIAGVGQQFEAARQNAQRELESFGINPSDTRYGALDIGVRTAEAAAKAAAATESDRATEETARQLRADAINVGRGYPSQVLGSSGAGTSAGGAANTGALDLTRTGAASMGTSPQYMGVGNQGLAQVGNFMSQDYQNQLGQHEADRQSSGLGALAGGILGSVMPFGGGGGGVSSAIPFFDKGGVVPEYDEGGAVPKGASPSRGAIPDDITARVSSGEFVVPADTVRWLGEKHFHTMIEKTNKERQEMPAQTGAIPGVARRAPPAALPPG